MKTYLDHSATTPVDKEVLKAMLPYFSEKFGNPSSIHSFGQEALMGVDEARSETADFLGAKSKEIIFTSGATESDNLAIFGSIKAVREILKRKNKKEDKLHVITSLFEHPAVLETCQILEKEGVEVTFLSPAKDGLVRAGDVEKNIKENTVLVTIMFANNEVGTVQPIAEIGEIIRREKVRREKKGSLPIIFHTDAVQAALFCNCRADYLKADLISLSGHKVYGPKGVGVLYVREGTPLKPVQYGGHQEYGLRSGTINAALIVGMGKALARIGKGAKKSGGPFLENAENKEIKELRDWLIAKVQKEISNTSLSGDKEMRVPSNANFLFEGVEGEGLLLMLDMDGFTVSTGSACAAGSLRPSHVLLSMGVRPERAHGSLRITLGKENTKEQLEKFVISLKKSVERLRKMAPK